MDLIRAATYCLGRCESVEMIVLNLASPRKKREILIKRI